MTNVIFCGGIWTTLWPLTRTLMPKQFVKLFNVSTGEPILVNIKGIVENPTGRL